ncbi:MAG: hypothetical protein Q6367_004550 [Candidatus Freyarchaeota archaeon]
MSKIKFLVASQEPGFSLRKKHNSKEAEKFLICECLNSEPSGTSPINKMVEIFGKNFDPSKDEIYWTHALKCVPMKSDTEIKNLWKYCAPHCVKHFKNELNLIPPKKLAVIAIGRYALALCRYVLQGEPLLCTEGIIKYIKTTNFEKNFSFFGGKKIFLYAFIHPSKREMVLRKWDKEGEVDRKEKEEKKLIRKSLQ